MSPPPVSIVPVDELRFEEPDLDRLAATVKRVAGITLPAHRRSMVASRLGFCPKGS